ncbi:hypothetical protein EDC96DRAFT_451662 [Choanephora cucurbitarum]|nr:hypothetical protein EDC96DRAFT_451662 [Choanephora cucurbitarum]
MLDLPSAKRLKGYLKHYTSEPHIAGSPNDRHLAEWTQQKMNEFGIPNTKIETYWPLLSHPVSQRLAIVSGPEDLRYVAKLKEDRIPGDEFTENPDVTPLFHGFSRNGTAKGHVIYANYGRLEDFQFLVDQEIQVNGSIALVRYGETMRGLQVKAAQQYGCVGVLIYSDPIEDGPLNRNENLNPSKSYPDGPWRPPSSVQRGSVSSINIYPGDPLTPGIPATQNATRLKMEEVTIFPDIPSLPLSWEDALPLLKATQGHGVFHEFDWAGGSTEVDYFSGPTEGLVEMENIVSYNITPVWNTIGRIEGSVEPERAIIIGNHRDAWIYGAVDPNSGSTVLLEIARVLGQMLQTGWRPKRTIILASWDAEEYGLIGSTEWVEENKEWLSKSGAVYVNCDSGVSGPYIEVAATPSLRQLMYEVSSMVTHPLTGRSVYEAWGKRTNDTGVPSLHPFVDIIGSGSDYTAFFEHIGISSIDVNFKGDYGVYHSIYDNFNWMQKYGDPEFKYHQMATQVIGLLVLRLADDLILPIHPLEYANELQKYVHQLYKYAAPHTFPSLKKAVNALVKEATAFEESLKQIQIKLKHFIDGTDADQKLSSKWAKRVEKMNQRLTMFERGFIDEDGVKGREWYKHLVYAPGLWTGYSGQFFPTIVEAHDAKDRRSAREAESRVTQAFRRAQNALA